MWDLIEWSRDKSFNPNDVGLKILMFCQIFVLYVEII